MDGITDADRAAAAELRVILADACGFWHRSGDDSPLCIALARHRAEAEKRLVEKLVPMWASATPDREAPRVKRSSEPSRHKVMLHHVDPTESLIPAK